MSFIGSDDEEIIGIFLPLFTNTKIKTFHKLFFGMSQREGETNVDMGM